MRQHCKDDMTEAIQAAAEELGVKRETVRNQLKSMFAKTETHRQGQLVALLSTLCWVMLILARGSPILGYHIPLSGSSRRGWRAGTDALEWKRISRQTARAPI